MNLSYDNNLFCVEAPISDNELLRRAGFAWDRRTKKWYTPFSTVANRLWKHVDPEMMHVHKLREVRNEIASRATESDFEVPHPKGLEFLPFQLAGIEYMVSRSNTLLADQMGLGKTIQVIGLCNFLNQSIRKILIICPATLKLNWLREWKKWMAKTKSIDVAYGKFYPNSDIVIINYDILARHHAFIHNKVWDLVVLDEAHYLKNPKANRTKQVVGYRQLPALKAKRKLALTGTPIVNRPVELFNIIKYLAPYGWWDKMKYARRYCAAFRGPWGWDMSGASNLAEFQEKLRSTIMIRRLKKDVLPQLPPKVHQIIELPTGDSKITKLLSKEKSLLGMANYNFSVKEYRDMMLSWAARHATKIGFGEMSTIRREVAEAKFPFIVKHLEDAIASSGKVVCFCHHRSIVAGLRNHFKYRCVTLVGDTATKERDNVVKRFQTEKEIELFVGNIQAAGLGITLTAASHVVFAEISWVPGEIEQCEDRCHRIGTTGSVLIQFLVMASSIDAAIAMTYIEKQGIIEKALDGKPSEDLGIVDLLK